MKRAFLWAGAPALLTALLDHATKWWAVGALCGPRALISVIPDYFDLRCSFNTGSAFGLFQGAGDILTVIGLGALAFVGYLIWKHPDARRRSVVALGLIAGGAIGNLSDRLARGHVVDFIDWHIGQRHWPAFNIADAALVVGVAMIMIWPEKAREAVGAHKKS